MTIPDQVIAATQASLEASLVEVARALDIDPASVGLTNASPASPPVQQAHNLTTLSGQVPDRLHSIFNPTSEQVFARRPLSVTGDTLFPQDPSAVQDDLPALGEQFKTLLCSTPRDAQAAVEHRLEVLRVCAWCLPSIQPGVSLYDLARIRAALAACLAAPQAGDLLLVGGDLSGIQDFLYTLSSKRAAKTLRGRSFYLQLLTEASMRRVLAVLGLTAANVLYAGGGHFYLLAPAGAEKTLSDLKAELADLFWKHHRTGLYAALGWAPLPAEELTPERVSGAWTAMQTQLRRSKQRRYQELGEGLYATVFELDAHGGNDEHTCSVCGEERGDTEAAEQDPEANTTIRVCGQCTWMAESLGAPLAQQDWVRLGLGAPTPAKGATVAPGLLAELGLHVSFERGAKWSAAVARELWWAFNDAAWDEIRDWRHDHVSIVRRYTVNVVPPLELREFTALVKKSEGIQRLGVLRADVDDLGQRFRQIAEGPGLGLLRVAALSSAMSLYFEGWVNHLAVQVKCSDGGLIYSVYSGGDDLFLIGPWHVMPDLAQTIARDFAAFSVGQAHLSAGLVLIHENYPVYQAAEDAAEALERAKHNPSKNSVDFLGATYNWQTFERIDQHHRTLITLVKKGKHERALLATLRQSGLDAAALRKPDGRAVIGPWLWRTVYQLKRADERAGIRPGAPSALGQSLRAELSADGYAGIFHLALAARWAQLESRRKSPDHAETER